jgi:hypothetical protein
MFEFPFMSFGLRNAAQTSHLFMDEVLKGLDFCFPYVATYSFLQNFRGARATSPNSLRSAPEARDPSVPGEVRLQRTRGQLSQLIDVHRGFPTTGGTSD